MLQGVTVAQMGLPASRPNTTYSSFCASIQKQGNSLPLHLYAEHKNFVVLSFDGIRLK